MVEQNRHGRTGRYHDRHEDEINPWRTLGIHNAKWIMGAMQSFQEDLFEWIESHQIIYRQI